MPFKYDPLSLAKALADGQYPERLENRGDTQTGTALEQAIQHVGGLSRVTPSRPAAPGLPPRYKWRGMGERGVGEKLSDADWHAKVPMMGLVKEQVDHLALGNAIARIRERQGQGEEPWKEDTALVRNVVDYLQYAEVRGDTRMAKIAEGIADLIPYAVEFYMTGGVSKGVQGGIGALTKGLVRKTAKGSLKRTALKAGIRGAGWLAGGLTRTGLMFPRVLKEAQERMTPGVGLTPDNQMYVYREADEPAKAVLFGGLSVLAENLSEVSGEVAMMPVYRWFGNLPGMRRIQGRLRGMIEKAWLKGGKHRTAAKFAALIRDAGYNGPLEEMSEERVGGLLRAFWKTDDFGLSPEENKGLGGLGRRILRASTPDADQVLTELGIMSAFPITQTAAGVAGAALEPPESLNYPRDFAISPYGPAVLWAEHADLAREIGRKERPTRKDMAAILRPGDRLSADERAAFAEMVRDFGLRTPASLLSQRIEEAQQVRDADAQRKRLWEERELESALWAEHEQEAALWAEHERVGAQPPPPTAAPPTGGPAAPVATPGPAVAPPGEPSPSGKPAEGPADTPAQRLAMQVAEYLRATAGGASAPLDKATLFSMADRAFGGTRAKGTYGSSEAHDAMEAGINAFLAANPEFFSGETTVEGAQGVARSLKRILDRIPTQSIRSGRRNRFQQFSTPADYAYAAVWAANIGAADRVLEPSAGTGSLAVHAGLAGAESIVVNELDENRANLLRFLGYPDIREIDAELIHTEFPDPETRPTVVVMNPPFSQKPGMKGRRQGTDRLHVDRALAALAPGGRLVAIMGAPLIRRGRKATMGFADWLGNLEDQYAVRANILVDPSIYKKSGTDFPTRLLVIDKVKPDSDRTGRDVVTGEARDAEHLIELLEGVRDARRATPVAGKPDVRAPSGERVGDGGRTAEPGVAPVGAGERPGAARPRSGRPGEEGGADAGRPEPAEGAAQPAVDEKRERPGAARRPGVAPPDDGGRGPSGAGAARPGPGRGPTPGEKPGVQPPGGALPANLDAILDKIKRKVQEEQGVGAAPAEAPAAAPEEGKAPKPKGRPAKGVKAVPAEKPKGPTLSEKAKESRDSLGEALRKFGEHAKGKLSINPFADPELWKLGAVVTTEALKAGVYNFADLIHRTIQELGEEWTLKLGPILQETWKNLRKEPGLEHLSAARDIRTYLSAGVVARATGAKGRTAEFTTERFHPWEPTRVNLSGMKPHPTKLIESAAMASVELPEATYSLNIPKELIESGKLSDAQLEAATFLAQAQEAFVSDQPSDSPHDMRPKSVRDMKRRQGGMLGDGTGTGKGRTIGALILDNWNRGRRKALWISEKTKLVVDAKRDLTDLGFDTTKLRMWGSTTHGEVERIARGGRQKIDLDEGVIFGSYALLRGNVTPAKDAPPNAPVRTRVDQILEWLPEDFDGLIVFDESHNMSNLGGAVMAQAANRLQEMRPNARVLYSSATGAKNVDALGYASRLGLWGVDTEFPTREVFAGHIKQGGLAMMEWIARDLKQLGLFFARSLTYNDGTPQGVVEYDRMVHDLSGEQEEHYDKLSEAWRIVYANIQDAMKHTGQDKSKDRSRAEKHFWNAQQRFFQTVQIAYSMPAVIEGIQEDLAEGRSAVVQLVNTQEASLERAVGDLKSGDSIEDIELSPLEQLMEYVRGAYPVHVYVEESDGHGGTRMVRSNAIDPQAVAARDLLLAQLESLMGGVVPNSPIDTLIEEFGVDEVAEITGRKQRTVPVYDEKTGTTKKTLVTRDPKKVIVAEADAFQSGEKRILVFSQMGDTGASYHASREVKNQQRRHHYVVQPGWQADRALQGLGRTHRSNQAWAPMVSLVTTNLRSQMRFISTIARRLDELGAVTQGQTDAQASSGLFNSATDNYESKETTDALRQFFQDIVGGQAPFSQEAFEEQTLLKLVGSDGRPIFSSIPITRLLNRLLSVSIEVQNEIFDFLTMHRDARIELARQNETLDVGMETFLADVIEKAKEEVVYVDEASGAETKHVTLHASHRALERSWNDAMEEKRTAETRIRDKVTKAGDVEPRFVLSPMNRTYLVIGQTTRESGRRGVPVKFYRLLTPRSKETRYQEAAPLDARWTPLTEEDAETRWKDEIEAQPVYKKQVVELVTGLILPIWTRVKGKVKVIRALTDEGEPILGRVIPRNRLADTLKSLGVDTAVEDLSPEDAMRMLERGEVTITLANKWNIQMRVVGKQARVEIGPVTYSYWTQLQAMGLSSEQIQGKHRFFIPVGDKGPGVYAALVKKYPVVDIQYAPDAHTIAPTRPLSGIPRDLTLEGKSKGKAIGQDEIVKGMARDFDVTVRSGRVRGKGVRGFYRLYKEVVRIHSQWVGDLYVNSHEIGHAIDDKWKILARQVPPAAEDELLRLATLNNPKTASIAEGFAEFLATFFTHDSAEAEAPVFFEWFMDLLQTEELKDLGQKIFTTRDRILQYRVQGLRAEAQKAMSRTGKRARPAGETFFDWTKDAFRQALHQGYAAMKDEGHFINLMVKEAIRRGGYRPAPGTSPYEIYRALTQTGPTLAHTALHEGVFTMTEGNRQIGPPLKDTFKEIPQEEYDDWTLWVWAKHALVAWQKGQNPGLSYEAAVAIYQAGEDNQRWQDAAIKFQAYNDALIMVRVDAGLLSKEEGEAILDFYEYYMPLHRILDDNVQKSNRPAGARRLVNLSKGVYRRFGSGLRVLDPVQATIHRTVTTYTQAAQQAVIQAMVTMVESRSKGASGMGKYMEWVASSTRKTVFTVGEAREQLEKAGIPAEILDSSDVKLDALMAIYRPDYTYRGPKPIARVMVDGKPRMYEFEKELFRAVSGMNYFSLHWALDMTFGKATRLVKLGGTGLSFVFAGRNPIKDYPAFIGQREYALGIKGAVEPLEMVARYIGSEANALVGREKNPIVKLWQEFGGEMGLLLGLDHKAIQTTVRDIVSDTTARRMWRVSTSPVSTLKAIIGTSEVGPRLAEFKRALLSQGWTAERLRQERPPRSVIVMALNAANDVTVDFRRMGWAGKYFDQFIPYFNAGLESLDKYARTWRDHPTRSLMYATMLAAGTFAYWITKLDEPLYDEQPAWLKYGFYTISDEQGRAIVRIPRTYEWGWTISSFVEMMLNQLKENDPQRAKEFALQAGSVLLPDIDVSLVTPILETTHDWDYWRDREIVGPDDLRRLEPLDQVKPWNLALSLEIAEFLGFIPDGVPFFAHLKSPAKLEHFAQGVTGGLYRKAVMPVEGLITDFEDYEAADIPLVGGFLLRNDYSQSVDDFYKTKELLTKRLNSAKLHKETVSQDSLDFLHTLDEYASLMAELRTHIRVEGLKSRDERWTIHRYMIGLAREALGRAEIEGAPSLLTARNVPSAIGQVRDRYLGRKAYQLSAPRPKRLKAESKTKFQARRSAYAREIARTRGLFENLGLTAEEARAALRADLKRRGMRPGVGSTGYSRRMGALGRRLK